MGPDFGNIVERAPWLFKKETNIGPGCRRHCLTVDPCGLLFLLFILALVVFVDRCCVCRRFPVSLRHRIVYIFEYGWADWWASGWCGLSGWVGGLVGLLSTKTSLSIKTHCCHTKLQKNILSLKMYFGIFLRRKQPKEVALRMVPD